MHGPVFLLHTLLGLRIFPSSNKARQAWKHGYTISWKKFPTNSVTCPFLEAFATCEDVLIKLNKPNKIQIRFN